MIQSGVIIDIFLFDHMNWDLTSSANEERKFFFNESTDAFVISGV